MPAWPPVIAWFVTSSWQLAFGLCPRYWPIMFYWELEAGASDAWAYLAVGTECVALLIFLKQKRFERVVQT